MPHSQRSGFTLVELLAAIAVGAIVLALISAGGQKAIARARSAQCLSHLRALGAATIGYAADNDMTLPATVHQRRQGLASWSKSLQPYAEGTLCFKCPCDPVNRPYSYCINDFLTPNPAGAGDLNFSRLTKLDKPASTILFAEMSDGYSGDHFHFASYRGIPVPAEVVKDQIAVERHDGSANYLFTEGHVENITWKHLKATLVQVPSTFIDPTSGDSTPTPNSQQTFQ
ncbi:MAG: type II secretion system protein [Terrimicrobiaceae bacterium]|nr:type II secretion system protein [Terrimicrobiaceae bacterium]